VEVAEHGQRAGHHAAPGGARVSSGAPSRHPHAGATFHLPGTPSKSLNACVGLRTAPCACNSRLSGGRRSWRISQTAAQRVSQSTSHAVLEYWAYGKEAAHSDAVAAKRITLRALGYLGEAGLYAMDTCRRANSSIWCVATYPDLTYPSPDLSLTPVQLPYIQP
jgi:hypothetical protein